ncbi:MAG: hypothetical protein E6J13_10730 [Chloroflexi bacterium]|nr:MAG: hypothetical protein E6J13_10730 [Chloroflexota bacterium]
MLARLDSIPGLREAAVDHRGELLRLVASDASVFDVVRGELSGLGYAAEEVSGLVPADVRWYAFDDVRDLSREEAEIIARRVTSAFRRSRALSDATAIRLDEAVAEALYRCLAESELGSAAAPATLRSACCDVAEEAARPILGDDQAREYAALLAKDLTVT